MQRELNLKKWNEFWLDFPYTRKRPNEIESKLNIKPFIRPISIESRRDSSFQTPKSDILVRQEGELCEDRAVAVDPGGVDGVERALARVVQRGVELRAGDLDAVGSRMHGQHGEQGHPDHGRRRRR